MRKSFRFVISLFIVSLLIVAFSGCKSETSKDKIATITGRVVYQDASQAYHAIDSAIVKAEKYYTQTKTDNAGNFTLEIELEEDSEEASIILSIFKTGFSSTSRSIDIKGGETTSLAGQDVILVATGAEDVNFAIIEGSVFGGTSQNPLENVTVTFSGAESEPVYSSASGYYSYSYQLNDGISEKTISATFERSGYSRHIETNLLITANETTTIGNVILTETSDTTSAAGEAYAIQVEEVGSNHIYVTESGLDEVTHITVEVSDVRGLVIDDLHRVVVNFEFESRPGVPGTEQVPTIYPAQVETVDGRATAYIQSGTKAGIVQLRVWFERENFSAEVRPEQIAIWGGFPMEGHFEVAPEKFNIAGMRWTGLEDDITAYMNDRYNNFIAPGTAVYFTTNYCGIGGSDVSNVEGEATVVFQSEAPRPDPTIHPDSAIVKIYGYVSGHPVGGGIDDFVDLVETTGVMLTGPTDYITVIKTSPAQDFYDQTHTIFNFEYHVQDIYGNPIVGNSSITVTRTVGDVSGDTSVEMNDTQQRGDGSTVFYFTWVAPDFGDDDWGEDVAITIRVRTPADGNGNRNASIVIPFGE